MSLQINATTAPALTLTNTTAPIVAADFHAFVSTLLSVNVLQDWLKLFIVGGLLETLRRYLSTLRDAISRTFWITANFDSHTDVYQWMFYWLSRQPVWKNARDVDVSTITFGLEKLPGDSDLDPNSQVSYLPSYDNTYSLWYKGRYIIVTRIEKAEHRWKSTDVLRLQILSRDQSILQHIIDEARALYKAAEKDMVSIYTADTTCAADWTLMTNRPKRPLSSIILDPGIKEMLMRDARDFLSSWKWYAERGIPFRRGYLLYGAPGSGKTSMIQSIAGDLGLNVYIVTLSRLGMDDAELNTLISIMPRRCIALIEDIDAALPGGMKRDLPSVHPQGAKQTEDDDDEEQSKKNAATAGVTLSGLLNALDGIGAHEGRILFATTNDYKALDPALCRPGRMDVHIEFKLASKYQAQALYKSFFVPDESDANGTDNTLPGHSDNSEKTPLLQPSLEHPSRPSAHGLSRHEVDTLAARFSDAIPERELSMASLQGYLMMYKSRPREAVAEAQQWVEQERQAREKRA